MNAPFDMARIASAVATLEHLDSDARLLALANIAESHCGRLDLPSAATRPDGRPVYSPILKSVEVFGVYAMADETDELPKNWMIAARNILAGAGFQSGGAR